METMEKLNDVSELVEVSSSVSTGDLTKTTVTVEKLSKQKNRKWLQGEDSIAGLLVHSTNEKMSFYQAMKKQILSPETAVLLLESQAATGSLIDPVTVQKLSVDEALQAGVIGPDVYDKLVSAEKAVLGYKDPYTGDVLSLFQAMKKDLIVKSHAIQLLEAQMATGGIIDPTSGHRIPVDMAYQRDMFDEKMNKILSDPSDDTRGYLDPNTQDNLTYLELKQRCVTDPSTGLRLLIVTDRLVKGVQIYSDEQIKETFKKTLVLVKHGRFRGRTVSLWEIINSEYFTEDQIREFIEGFKSRKVTVERIVTTVTTTIEQTEKEKKEMTFRGLRRKVSALELLDSKIIDQNLFHKLEQGVMNIKEVSKLQSVDQYLTGTCSIAGVLVESTKEKMSIYRAMTKQLLMPGTALVLLEAQAATGFVIDPVKNLKVSVDEAVKAGLVGPELRQKLLSAERAVTGYKDPYTGDVISLFQALKKDLIVQDHGIRLLEAQIATGGIIDPVQSHRLPVDVAYERGMFDEEMNKILSDPSDDTKGFFDPNTRENLTYLQLKERCVTEGETGLCLLCLRDLSYVDKKTAAAFKEATFSITGGKFQGKTISIWEFLNSEYLTDTKRREIVQEFRSSKITLQQIITTFLMIIEETENKTRSPITVDGFRKKVSLQELLNSEVIGSDTFEELQKGKKTVEELLQMGSVKKYLQGDSSISGILLEPSKEKMSIYQAMTKQLLMPGTALVLLEAQAATGFVIDPVRNLKVSVDEAVKAGLVGPELRQKLLSAERAVTGYKDPYTGDVISLFQALKKDLIVKDHGIRLLEAQIATGGIIDPVQSHRLPIDVAYERGMFDEEMNKILSDAGDDTKGFFDPNTRENLTYLQLKERCVTDPDTNLCLLPLKTSVRENVQIQAVLSKNTVTVSCGKYKGKSVTIWELINSEYISKEQRRDLLERFRSGKMTIETVITTITTIIEETETKHETQLFFPGLRAKVTATELLKSDIINEETYEELQTGSKAVTEVMHMESVRQYLEGMSSIAGVLVESTAQKMSIYQAMTKKLLMPGTALVLLEAQAATGFVIDPVKNLKVSVDEAVKAGLVGPEFHQKLLSAERAVTGYKDPYTGDVISLFQALKKDLIVKDHGIRLLEAQIATGGIIDPVQSHRLPIDVAYERGMFDEEMNKILSDAGDDTKGFFDPNTRENLTYLQLKEKCVTDPDTGLCLLKMTDKSVRDQQGYSIAETESAFQGEAMSVTHGKFKGKTVSVWELIHSEYFTEEQRKELIQKYKRKEINMKTIITIITTIIEETQTQTDSSITLTSQGYTAEETEAAFRSATVCFSVWCLIHSKLFTEDKRKELIEKYGRKEIDMETIIRAITTIITETQTQTDTSITFSGLRNKVSLQELVESQIIDQKTLQDLKEGRKTVEDVSELDSVKVYLKGADSIAGVLVESTKEKMSIYQAMTKQLLMPGTALVLLEAQAATGFVIDPVKNLKVSVDEAVKAGLVGPELRQKLLSAERAVTGYKDPYTGDVISLFQALKKDLIVKDHGIRLLEAQIATGGIIDPVQSHRLPVDVAYKRGMFDEEMNKILSDAGDDTKGFFDPNTRENLTYLQLKERCVTDHVTGLCLLLLKK
ncbi:plectin-like [Heptranchias perlo]|uniref:plectin-like n=1 Tax=Heptranchias perlo TaxID=212740 RepID=UPI00355A1214